MDGHGAPTGVAAALRDGIVSGRLRAGERIKEVPLAERLGISRGPIRDALRLLEHDGLIAIAPNRGAVVPAVDAADVLEVYAMRATLGSLALQKLLLVDDLLPADRLERALQRFEHALERGSATAAAEADLGYQSTIVASAGLVAVTRQFERLTWQVRMFIATLGVTYDDKLPVMLRELERLHAAILSRRRVEAERLWRDKFERWVRDFADRLDEGFDADLWGRLTAGSGIDAARLDADAGRE